MTASSPSTQDARARVVYFVPPSRQFAGIERVVHEIADGLMAAHGDILDVHVVFGSRYDEPLLRETRYVIHVLDVAQLRELPNVLRRAIRGIAPDVVIFPQIEASVLGWIATRGLGVPVFVTHLHGNPRLEEREGTKRTKAAFLAFRRVVSSRIAAVLAVSPSLARYAATELSPVTPVRFAKNPVRDLGQAERVATTDEVFRFVCVARLARQKGQDILLRAIAIARPQLPPTVFTLVGGGPAERELHELARELGIADIVDFVGYATDPRPYLATADCFVLASRWEGFGVALAEALQFGLPLLATDCDFGPADLINDPRIGEVVESENPLALAEGILRATGRAADPIAEEFRRAAGAEYLPELASESHFEILAEISGRFAARSAGLSILASAAPHGAG